MRGVLLEVQSLLVVPQFLHGGPLRGVLLEVPPPTVIPQFLHRFLRN